MYSLSLLFSFFIKILSNISNILLLIIYLWRIVAWESAAICFYNITNMRLLDQKSQKMMVYNHFQWGCKIISWKKWGHNIRKMMLQHHFLRWGYNINYPINDTIASVLFGQCGPWINHRKIQWASMVCCGTTSEACHWWSIPKVIRGTKYQVGDLDYWVST